MGDLDGSNHDHLRMNGFAKYGSLLPLNVEKWLQGGRLESHTRLENGNSNSSREPKLCASGGKLKSWNDRRARFHPDPVKC